MGGARGKRAPGRRVYLPAARGSPEVPRREKGEPIGAAVNSDQEEFWLILPAKALHPTRVPTIEALWWIGEPLSAVDLVDVHDGFLSMWEAAHHLRALESLGVTEPVLDAREGTRRVFDVPYRLKKKGGG